MPCAATWMDLETIILSEVSQTKTGIRLYCFNVESKKESEGQGRLVCCSQWSHKELDIATEEQ